MENRVGDSHRPTEALLNTQSTSNIIQTTQREDVVPSKKRRNHRAGRRRKNRRQSFAIPDQEGSNVTAVGPNMDLHEPSRSAKARPPFYRLGQSGGRNLSETSIDSSALLDHR